MTDLCWVGVLVLVCVSVMPFLFGSTECTPSSITKSQLAPSGALGTALSLYRNHMGSYPTSLSELTQNADGSDKWRGPYIDSPEDLNDAWGNNIR